MVKPIMTCGKKILNGLAKSGYKHNQYSLRQVWLVEIILKGISQELLQVQRIFVKPRVAMRPNNTRL